MSGTLSCPFSPRKETQHGIWENFDFSFEAQSEAYACLSFNFHMGMDGCKWRIYQKVLDERGTRTGPGIRTEEIPNRPADKIQGAYELYYLDTAYLLGSRYYLLLLLLMLLFIACQTGEGLGPFVSYYHTVLSLLVRNFFSDLPPCPHGTSLGRGAFL